MRHEWRLLVGSRLAPLLAKRQHLSRHGDTIEQMRFGVLQITAVARWQTAGNIELAVFKAPKRKYVMHQLE